MSTIRGRVVDLARTQHDAVAVWQLRRLGMTQGQIDAGLRGLRRVYKGVCALGDLSELGWLMAAALAAGPAAAISHITSVRMLGLRPWEPHEIHVSVPRGGGRAPRDGIVTHRRTHPFEITHHLGIPLTSPTQSLKDAALQPYELYRALEEADRRWLRVDRDLLGPVAELQRTVKGRTRSDAEARFILLCHDQGIRLPLVNHRLNGFETDFHWPAARLVVEVDGWEFHSEREQFEKDRRRGAIHRIAGYEVLRFSAIQVACTPEIVAAAVRAAAPALRRAAAR